jgi:putative transcriptional regulator
MTTFSSRHPLADELLLDYATGAASEPIALMAASQAALNEQSRTTLRGLDAVGGALLHELEPATIADSALDRALSQLGVQELPAPQPGGTAVADTLLPPALRAYVPGGIDALPWRHRPGGLNEAELPCGDGKRYKVSLLRISAGRPIVHHTHQGEEMLLVLKGGFSDGRGHYVRGDVCYADDTVEHRPVADADGECLCLAITEAPIRVKGLLGFLLRPFLRR